MGKSKEEFTEIREQEIQEERGLTFELKSLLQADKSMITALSQHLVDKVAKGLLDPVDAFSHAKKIGETSDLLMENLRPFMESHINISKGEKYIKYGIEFTQADIGVKYDYSNTGDREYEEIMGRFNAVKKEKDAKEAELKKLTKPRHEFNPETGETWTVNPPVRSGRVGIKTEFK